MILKKWGQKWPKKKRLILYFKNENQKFFFFNFIFMQMKYSKQRFFFVSFSANFLFSG